MADASHDTVDDTRRNCERTRANISIFYVGKNSRVLDQDTIMKKIQLREK